MTNKYKKIYKLTYMLSILLAITPLIICVILGFKNGSVGSKFTLGICIMLAAILTLVNLLFKYHIRSTIWILLIGIYVSLQKITPLLIVMAVTTIINEFILEPISRAYKQKYIINKEIDKRG